jgi:hypothetical protein
VGKQLPSTLPNENLRQNSYALIVQAHFSHGNKANNALFTNAQDIIAPITYEIK